MTQPVFISYARDASREHAQALHKALGERTAFLDTQDIATGERFPEALVDALFGARVVVIFAEPRYFTRWYCLLEFRIARTPFLRVADRPGATAQEKADALRGLVIAMPPRGVDPMMDRFPPLVQGRNWPDVGDIERIAALVEAELAANPPTLRERYAAVADANEARRYLLEATRLPPPRRIGNVPFVPQTGLPPTINDAFVGRADDLWRIHDLLWTERGDPATAAGLTGAIEATGGFGKTRLALEYLYRFGPAHFRGGLFWINAESDAELQLYDVLQALNPSAPAIEVVRQGSAGVPGAVARAIRSRPDDAPTPLFIIDNVPEPQPDQPPKPLETWCPVLGEVPVLTTSRTRVALGAGGGVVALPIDTLDPASAVDLLTTAMRRAPLTDAEWDEIAAWVGYLPLALEVLNRLLRSGEMVPRDVLNLSRNQRPSAAVDAAMESIRHVVPEGALRGTTEAFSASYNLLTPEEQYAARLIAWMAPAPVPTFVIEALGPEVFAPGIRAKLRNRSFVTVAGNDPAVVFGAMHRVLADFIRAQSLAAGAEVEAVASCLQQLVQSADRGGTDGSARLRDCAAPSLSLFENCAVEPQADNLVFQIASFSLELGLTLSRWGYLSLANSLLIALASEARRMVGDEHLDTLACLNALALTQGKRGDYKQAEELHDHILKLRQRIQGEDHPDTLSAMNNLALIKADQGDYVAAQELHQRVLDTLRRVCGDDYPDTLRSMLNLADLLNKRGRYREAEDLQTCALPLMRRVFGEEHPMTLTLMSSLAATRHEQGDFEGAKELQERVLRIRLRVLGEEHPGTIASLEHLANSRNALLDHRGAEELLGRILAWKRRMLGNEHPDTLTSMSNLALVRYALGDIPGAQKLHEQVLEGRRRILGDEHPQTLHSLGNLAQALLAQGDGAGAQERQERALERIQLRMGVEHRWTLAIAVDLLRLYLTRKDYSSVRRLLNGSLHWLLTRAAETLTDEQRRVQTELQQLVSMFNGETTADPESPTRGSQG